MIQSAAFSVTKIPESSTAEPRALTTVALAASPLSSLAPGSAPLVETLPMAPAEATATQTVTPPPAGPPDGAVISALGSVVSALLADQELIKWELFRRSPHYLEPFEADVISIPEGQLNFVRQSSHSDSDLLLMIAREAIDRRNRFAPSISLLFKYTAKVLGNLVRRRLTESRIRPRVDAKPSFFLMLADLVQRVLARSDQILKATNYTRATVDVERLYERTRAACAYVVGTIDVSPVGGYHKWNRLILYRGQANQTPLVEEAADIWAVSSGC